MKTFEYSQQFAICFSSQRNMRKARRKIEKRKKENEKKSYIASEKDKGSKREEQEVQFYEDNTVSQGIVFCLLKVYNSAVYSIFTELCVYHHCLILEHIIPPCTQGKHFHHSHPSLLLSPGNDQSILCLWIFPGQFLSSCLIPGIIPPAHSFGTPPSLATSLVS